MSSTSGGGIDGGGMFGGGIDGGGMDGGGILGGVIDGGGTVAGGPNTSPQSAVGAYFVACGAAVPLATGALSRSATAGAGAAGGSGARGAAGAGCGPSASFSRSTLHVGAFASSWSSVQLRTLTPRSPAGSGE